MSEDIDRRLVGLHPVRRKIVETFLDRHKAWDTDFEVIPEDGSLRWNYKGYPWAEVDMGNFFDSEDEEPEDEDRGRMVYRYREKPALERGFVFDTILIDRDPIHSADFERLLRRFTSDSNSPAVRPTFTVGKGQFSSIGADVEDYCLEGPGLHVECNSNFVELGDPYEDTPRTLDPDEAENTAYKLLEAAAHVRRLQRQNGDRP